MHRGMSFDALGALILDQKARKWDIVVPSTRLLAFDAQIGDNGRVTPSVTFTHNGHGETTATLTSHAFEQMTGWAEIPAKYVDRLKTPEHLALLKENVQHWLNSVGAKRMLRLFKGDDGTAILRAYLSDKYRRFDNYDLGEQIMPIIGQQGFVLKSGSITEKRLYLQIVDRSYAQTLTAIQHGQTIERICHPGVCISNSEVGSGRLTVESLVYDRYCMNGTIFSSGIRRNHVGRGLGGDEESGIEDLLTDETKALDDAAFWAKVKDVTLASFDHARFAAAVSRMQNATEIEIPLAPDVIMDVTAERAGLNSDERDAAFRHLFSSGDTSLFGISAAITRTAQDVDSYDRSIELQRTGNDTLNWTAADMIKAAEDIARRAKK